MSLFTDRSILTMLHGIILGGGSLLAFSAALYCMWSVRTADGADVGARQRCRHLARLSVAIAIVVWLAVLIGTYIVFPPYRAVPPEGATELGAYPKALIQSSAATDWLHSFGMEVKEHVPWMVAMLVTAVAFVTNRYHASMIDLKQVRGAVTAFLAIGFTLTAIIAALGMFANKVAPLV